MFYTDFQAGDQVRLKGHVTLPAGGAVTHQNVGVVVLVDPEAGLLTVDFPNHPAWLGIPTDMELAYPVQHTEYQ